MLTTHTNIQISDDLESPFKQGLKSQFGIFKVFHLPRHNLSKIGSALRLQKVEDLLKMTLAIFVTDETVKRLRIFLVTIVYHLGRDNLIGHEFF